MPLSGTFKVSDLNLAKRIFNYSKPLIVMSILSWMINYFDRYAIDFFLDSDEVGIYNASYGLGSRFFLFLSPIFITILTPKIYSNIKLCEKKKILENVLRYYTLISFFLVPVIYFTYDFLGNLLLSDNYSSGFYLIAGINLGYFFLTTCFVFEIIFYSEGTTKYIFYTTLIAALFNILLNIYLIPIYGLTGAMLSSIFTFFIKLMTTIYFYTKL
jgi:O-antigen/teichoic acid export membrane protein